VENELTSSFGASTYVYAILNFACVTVLTTQDPNKHPTRVTPHQLLLFTCSSSTNQMCDFH